MRLPHALDRWFTALLDRRPEISASDLLVRLVHGGLRLRDGYMAVHRRTLEEYASGNAHAEAATYRRCLVDTFSAEYVAHLDRWLEADGIPVAGEFGMPRKSRVEVRATAKA